MINIAINNESLYKTAQALGHHNDVEETIENALQVYITFLQGQNNPQETDGTTNNKTRIFGQHQGLVTLSDDFDNALPDSFWLGDDK